MTIKLTNPTGINCALSNMFEDVTLLTLELEAEADIKRQEKILNTYTRFGSWKYKPMKCAETKRLFVTVDRIGNIDYVILEGAWK